MYNCYNEAFNYLIGKYPNRLNILKVPDNAPEVDLAMFALMGYYSYGIYAKKLLWEFCVELNLIPKNSNPLK